MAKKPKEIIDFTSIEMLIDVIEKNQGAGAIRQGDSITPCDVISTGALNLDIALGIGGIPRGRITEIYGPEASGKTTLTLNITANAQKAGGRVAFIDVEHALDPAYAKSIGVNMDKLLISQPDSAEQALDIVETLCHSKMVDLVIIDSVAALVPKAELEGTMGQAHMGLQARLLSQACRKLKGAANNSKTALIFINQIREKIGVMFGSPETTSGGRALKFYSSIRIDIRRIATIKNDDGACGNLVRTKVVKNKLSSPFKQAEFEIIFGKGINKIGCILDVGAQYKLIDKKGSHYTYNGVKLGNGVKQACATLNSNSDIVAEIRNSILKKFEILKSQSIVGVEDTSEDLDASSAILS